MGKIKNILRRIIFFFYRLFIFITFNKMPAFGSAVFIIKDRRDKYLVIKRSDELGYSFPGGLINTKEDILNGARRELFEETGINKVKNIELFNVYKGKLNYKELGALSVVYSGFVKIKDRELKKSGEGIPMYLNKEEILTNCTKQTRKMLLDYEKYENNKTQQEQ